MALPSLHHDFETRSAVDLKKCGLYRYFEDPTTGVWVMRWRLGEGPIEEWRPGDPAPATFFAAMAAGYKVVAHNAAFERACWAWIRRRLPGCDRWPELLAEHQDCTMARAAALGLPQALDGVADVLGLDARKDSAGYRLMMQMCKPRNPADENPLWHDDPAKVDRLSTYCAQDVEVETAVDKRLPALTAPERRVWELDQRVNERGVALDTSFARRAAAICTEAQARADREMFRLTKGAVEKVTQVARIAAWLNEQGVECKGIGKGDADEVIARAQVAGRPDCEAVVRLRRAAAKSSTAKYVTINSAVCADGRMRGILNYHGAHTGRWSGRLLGQNIPRLKEENRDLVPGVFAAVMADRPMVKLLDGVEFMSDQSVLEAMSWMLRPTIISARDRKLVGGDYSNIEGRINAWLAGETWKVQAFRDFDAGRGLDLYILAYARAFGVHPSAVTKALRQLGKVMELSMGYQGGVGAFHNMAANYGVSVTDERADELKKAWREAHPAIVQSWWDLDDAVIAAVSAPGLVVPVYGGRVQFTMHQGMLLARLPSGRCLHYHSPSVERVEIKDRETGEGTGRFKRATFVYGVDSTTKKWTKYSLYGGLICENIVQAVARDVMVDGMMRAEAEGFPLILTVHDELLTEPHATSLIHAADTLNEIMTVLPPWAKGLPLAAGTWEDERYVK